MMLSDPMIREKKFIFLTVLTILIYGFGLFLESYFFLLPFPIFDFVLLYGVLRFLFMNAQSRKGYGYLFLLSVILKITINPILSASFLNESQLVHLNTSIIPDILLILSLSGFLASFIAWNIQEKLSIHWIVHLCHAVIVVVALVLDLRMLIFFCLLPAIILYLRNNENNFRYIWNLYFILELMTSTMSFFVTH